MKLNKEKRGERMSIKDHALGALRDRRREEDEATAEREQQKQAQRAAIHQRAKGHAVQLLTQVTGEHLAVDDIEWSTRTHPRTNSVELIGELEIDGFYFCFSSQGAPALQVRPVTPEGHELRSVADSVELGDAIEYWGLG